MSETTERTREPFQARGLIIYAGSHEHDVAIGEVYNNGQPHPEEMAQVWAAAYCTMYPALANIRNVARRAVETERYETMAGLYGLLAGIAKAAGDALFGIRTIRPRRDDR